MVRFEVPRLRAEVAKKKVRRLGEPVADTTYPCTCIRTTGFLPHLARHPVMLTRGCASYVWSRRMSDQVDFTHSVVTYRGAGDSIVIPEKRYNAPSQEIDEGMDETLLRDHYPDGVNGFVSTDRFDYAAEPSGTGISASRRRSMFRTFLFLKPDVLVIRDQIRSPYPLQWNLHLPADEVSHTGNRIDVTARDGVHLAIDFLRTSRWISISTGRWKASARTGRWCSPAPTARNVHLHALDISPSACSIRSTRAPVGSWKTLFLILHAPRVSD